MISGDPAPDAPSEAPPEASPGSEPSEVATPDPVPETKPDEGIPAVAETTLETKPEAKPEAKPDAKPEAKSEEGTPAAPAEAKPGTEKAAETPFTDPYPDVALSRHARAETGQQFTKLKMRAAADLAARDAKLAEAAAKIAELEKQQPAEALTDDVKAELNTLRAFRESIALEGDPIFVKKYDEPINNLDQAVLNRLKTEGFTDEDLAKIKEIGVGNLEWSKVLEARPGLAPFINRKLGERDGLVEKKQEAAQRAKTDYAAAVAEQRGVSEARRQEEVKASTTSYEKFVSEVAPLRVVPIPADASPEQRSQLIAANKAVTDALHLGKSLLLNAATPEGRAEAAAIAALAQVFKHQATGASGAYTAEAAAHTKTKSDLDVATKELAKVKQELDALRAAGRIAPSRVAAAKAAPGGVGEFASANEALARFKNEGAS